MKLLSVNLEKRMVAANRKHNAAMLAVLVHEQKMSDEVQRALNATLFPQSLYKTIPPMTSTNSIPTAPSASPSAAAKPAWVHTCSIWASGKETLHFSRMRGVEEFSVEVSKILSAGESKKFVEHVLAFLNSLDA